MAIKVGQYVHHAKYGNGIIVERDDDRTTVDFDTAGVRKFVTAMAFFEAAEGEAPKKKRGAGRPKSQSLASTGTGDVGTAVVVN